MKTGWTKAKLREKGFVFLGVIVPIVTFITFYVAVNLQSIFMAFQDEYTNAFTLHHFKTFFVEITANKLEGGILESTVNTLKFFGVNLMIVFPSSLFFSYFLHKKIWMYKFFRIVFFLPMIISPAILTSLYKEILNGPFSEMCLKLFHMSARPFFLDSEEYALNSILAYTVWLGLGSNMIIFLGTMTRVPQEVLEGARLDGIGYWGELFRMVIPMIWPTVSTLILLTFIGIFQASGPILLFTQGRYKTFTIAYWIYEKTVVSASYHYGSAVGLVFTAIGVPLMFFVRWVLAKFDTEVEF